MLLPKLEGLGLAMGGNLAPTAIRCENLNNGTSYVLEQRITLILMLVLGDTYIRGGKAGSIVHINDIAGGEVRIARSSYWKVAGHAGVVTPQSHIRCMGTATFLVQPCSTEPITLVFSARKMLKIRIMGGKASSRRLIMTEDTGGVSIAQTGGLCGVVGDPQAPLSRALDHGTAAFKGTDHYSLIILLLRK
jgi:hypothetical protein